MEFGFKFAYKANTKHQAAYRLSRLPTTGMDQSLLKDEVQTLMKTKAQPKGENRNGRKYLD